MQSVIDFIVGHGDAITGIVAVIALIQPWCLAAWERFFRPGHIAIYETGTIEVGYSIFGPTLGLSGTLKAFHRDLFIRRIRLEVVKQKDHSLHNFEWGMFRSHKMTYGSAGSGEEVAMEIPYSFMVTSSQPHRYNIIFYDEGRLEEMRPYLTAVRTAWYHHLQSSNHSFADPATAYASFNSTKPHVTAYTALDRLYYWEQCTYGLSAKIETEDGKSFEKRWSFSLTSEDEQNLRYNPIVIIQNVCELPNFRYMFAYSRYRPTS